MARIAPTGPSGWDGPNWPNGIMDQINEQTSTDVVVDGPCGCNDLCPGRRRLPLTRLVDGAEDRCRVYGHDRLVEESGRTRCPPNFDHEVLVQDTVLEHLKYFTHDDRVESLPRRPRPASVRTTRTQDTARWGRSEAAGLRRPRPSRTRRGAGEGGAARAADMM